MINVLKSLREKNEKRSVEGFGMELNDWSSAEWGNAIAGEVGEMCNILKKVRRGDKMDDYETLLGYEMADVIIYIDLLAKKEGIDLEKVIVEKFNIVSDRVNSDIKL